MQRKQRLVTDLISFVARREFLSAFSRSARFLLTWPVFLGRHGLNALPASLGVEMITHFDAETALRALRCCQMK